MKYTIKLTRKIDARKLEIKKIKINTTVEICVTRSEIHWIRLDCEINRTILLNFLAFQAFTNLCI